MKHSTSLKVLVITFLIGCGLFSCQQSEACLEISGTVYDEHGSVDGAVVRIQTTEFHTTSNSDGDFTIIGPPSSEPVFVTAWKSGYFIVGAEATPGEEDVEIHLHAHASEDNPDYEWLPSLYHPGQGENQGCAECHSRVGVGFDSNLPVDEWLLDAHSQTARNERFLTMYTGTDTHGNKSPATRFASNRDYGRFPLRPDFSKPYYGPGYKLDFPETLGNCAACHTPAASINNPYQIDPTAVKGVAAEGIPCDFCHKIWDVKLNPSSEMPYPNMPGVLSYEFRRPPEGHQFFAGPYDDVAPGEDTFSPIQRESAFCAPCHFGVFWDVVVYNSYGEWLESSYSDPDTGQTCQDCHMPHLDVTHFALPYVGGLERSPDSIFSHLMPGASDEELLMNAVTMDVEAQPDGNRLLVTVTITNDKTGHHVPTDSPLRHLILWVDVTDDSGEILTQVDGPVVPDWCGSGNPGDGYLALMPGTAYAKILMELWTEIIPSGAYWNPTQVMSDNRIPAFGSDTTVYTFDIAELPGNRNVEVDVKLFFRRAFINLVELKDWDAPDILMEEYHVVIPID